MSCEWPFPLLLPLNTTGTHYAGYIGVSQVQYEFEMVLREEGKLTSSTTFLSPSLGELLGQEGLRRMEKRRNESPNVTSFLIELQSLIQRAEKEKRDLQASAMLNIAQAATPRVCLAIVQELEGIWSHLEGAHPSLCSIQMNFRDSRGRKHIISVHLPPSYPSAPPTCLIEMPEPLVLSWGLQSTLKDVLRQYQSAAEKYITLWDELDEIDTNSWVLEPDKPSYSNTLRRIALESHCSVQIELVGAF
jgi:E3 ubiquitin-protein ligase FANCL